MKKKHLSTRLTLNKKTITTLNPGQSLQAMGGNDSRVNPSVCPCIPPTEPQGCSNGCASVAIDILSHCCPTHVCIPATEPQGCSNACPVTA